MTEFFLFYLHVFSSLFGAWSCSYDALQGIDDSFIEIVVMEKSLVIILHGLGDSFHYLFSPINFLY